MADFRKRGKVWYYRFTNADGRRAERKGCPDRKATEAMAREAETRAALEREGLVDPTAEAYRRHGIAPLSEHLDAFITHLRDKGRVARYIQQVESNVRRILERGRLERIADLTPERVGTALATLRSSGLSLRTVHHSMRHVKGFSMWLRDTRRAREHALAPLAVADVETDRRRFRRSLTSAEASRLIKVAEAGPIVLGMGPGDRAMLYRVALGTGYRRGELAHLTPTSFALDGPRPAITCEAKGTKNRRRAVQPIKADLAELLRPWLSDKPLGQPVFILPDKPARMLRADLKAAGIPATTDDGVIDFHSLRHSYVTWLIANGANVKVVQLLARHSTASLTLDRYAHASLDDRAAAVDSLPAIDPSRAEDDPTPRTEEFAPYLPHAEDGPRRPMSSIGGEADSEVVGIDGPNPVGGDVLGGLRRLGAETVAIHPAGLEPATLSSED